MARKKRLRTTRRPLHLEGAVVAGSPRHRPIVYGYRFPSRPDVMKIGYSSRGVERIREQTTGFPEAPQVVFIIHHKDSAAIEKRIHQSLVAQQIHDTVGVEWFRVHLEDVVKVSPELRGALGRQRWKSPLRWLCAGLGVPVGLVVAPVVATALGRPDALDADAMVYARALVDANPQAWSLAAGEAWRVVMGPVGTETRLVAAFPVAVMVWLAFLRRR